MHNHTSLVVAGSISTIALSIATYFFLCSPLLPSQQQFLSAPSSRLTSAANLTRADALSSSSSSSSASDSVNHLLDPSSPSSSPSSLFPIDALIVLGYAVDHEASVPTHPLQDRLEAAARFLCDLQSSYYGNSNQPESEFKSNHDLQVILSGGISPQHPSHLPTEAQIMYKHLMDLFPSLTQCNTRRKRTSSTSSSSSSSSSVNEPEVIPPGISIELEGRSTSTRTNALYSIDLLFQKWDKQLLRETDGGSSGRSRSKVDDDSVSLSLKKRVVLVTNRFHQYRSLATFEKATMEKQEQQKREDPERTSFTSIEWFVLDMEELDSVSVIQFNWWREVAGIAYYKLLGYI